MRRSTHSGHWMPQITRARRCKEGFYLLIGHARIWYRTRSKAIKALHKTLFDFKIGVVSARDYAKATRRAR
jgi:hypothetical protein